MAKNIISIDLSLIIGTPPSPPRPLQQFHVAHFATSMDLNTPVMMQWPLSFFLIAQIFF